MVTNHVMMPDDNGRVYCYALRKILPLRNLLKQGLCQSCMYYTGSAQGEGIECSFDSGSKVGIETVYEPDRFVEERNLASNNTTEL